jgi:hypothetical protein
MKLSHSKLSLLLKDPMSYYLKYKLGFSAIATKPALSLGSAVHWGLEHSTDDLSEYYDNPLDYSDEQALAEAMVHGYLKHKDEIFSMILSKRDGSKLNLVKETHEMFIEAPLKSYMHSDEDHKFIGIADLLLETDEGLVLIDYKTSSKAPEWNGYLDQIYRYIFMLKKVFPDKPVCKIGIVNLRKAALRKKVNESQQSWVARMKHEYDVNESAYIYVHMYEPEDLNATLVDSYIANLSKMADTAEMIEKNSAYYINFGCQMDYGKSEYYDIFYKTPNAFALYNISDTVFDDDGKLVQENNGGRRPCVEIDLNAIEDDMHTLNKYFKFKNAVLYLLDKGVINDFSKDLVFSALKKEYVTDDSLLNDYWEIMSKELSDGVVS